MSNQHGKPHRRYNALNGSWVLVSPHRTARPWQGAQESQPEPKPSYDPECYLCPTNKRTGGEQNPDYKQCHVFDNDFPALLKGENADVFDNAPDSELLRAENVDGKCRVICYHPQHDLHLAQMNQEQIVQIIHCWRDQYIELSQQFAWVQIFENRGQAMGCSNPHPHGQIWATSSLPTEATAELEKQQAHWNKHNTALLLDYAQQEQQAQDRIVLENQDWLVVVPYWATWPFETLLLPRFKCADFEQLGDTQIDSLALTLKQLNGAYDKVFDTEFPYSMGWHARPSIRRDEPTTDAWQLHAHFYPPLLRSASVKKFMVGYELLSEAQRDITPEQSAKTLRQALKNYLDDL